MIVAIMIAAMAFVFVVLALCSLYLVRDSKRQAAMERHWAEVVRAGNPNLKQEHRTSCISEGGLKLQCRPMLPCAT